MSLKSLPLEILLHIAGYIEKLSEFLLLVSLNRYTYILFTPELYKRDVASTGGQALLFYAMRGIEKGVRGMLAGGAEVN